VVHGDGDGVCVVVALESEGLVHVLLLHPRHLVSTSGQSVMK
jgi:hypothetical protein